MSREYDALLALRQPPDKPRPGDMWLCERLGIVNLFLGHKRNSRRGRWPTSAQLYFHGEPSLWARPYEWKDDQCNAYLFYPDRERVCGELWRYVGNLFDRVPYRALVDTKETQ